MELVNLRVVLATSMVPGNPPTFSGWVLWAEDSEADRGLISAALEEWQGPAVRFVEDGLKALEALEDGRPGLVVLDLRMPRMGGLEALRRIRANPATKNLPVAVFTGGDIPHELEELRELGVVDIQHKPPRFEHYQQAVLSLVARAKA